jgi:hypothetical protein
VSGSKECIQIWRGTLPDHPLYGHPFSLIQLPGTFVVCSFPVRSHPKQSAADLSPVFPPARFSCPPLLHRLTGSDGRLASGAQENCIYIYTKPQSGKDHKGERVVCEQTLSAHNNPVWTLATLAGLSAVLCTGEAHGSSFVLSSF